jgi:hypothetical protein
VGAGAASTASAGAAAMSVAGTGGSATTSGFAAFTNWVIGTHAGQAAAAAVTAVIVGGTAVGVGVVQSDGQGSSGRPPGAAGPATAGGELPVPQENAAPGGDRGAAGGGPGVPTGTGAPGSRPSGGAGGGQPGGGQPGRGSDPGSGGAGGTEPGSTGGGRPGDGPGKRSGSPGSSASPGLSEPGRSAPGGGSPAPTQPVGPATLDVGAVQPAQDLRQGIPGELRVVVQNTGSGTANDLEATVSLPEGLSVRAGGPDSFLTVGVILGAPDKWTCRGSARTATCTATSLRPDEESTIRVKVFVARTATGGTVSGQVTAADGIEETIPSTPVDVLP